MLKIKQRVKCRIRSGNKTIPMSALALIVSFVSLFGEILGMPSSINVAICVLSGQYIMPAFVGTMLGYALTGSVFSGIIQICSILVIGGVKLCMRQHPYDNAIVNAVITTATMLMFGSEMSVATASNTYVTSFRMINAVVCGCVVYMGETVLEKYCKDNIVDISGFGGVFAAILYVMAICTLSSFPVPALNLVRIIGTFVIYLAAKKYRTLGGAVVGALTVFGVLLCSPSLTTNSLILATSGLICGAFMQISGLVAVMVYLVFSLISLVAVGTNSDTFVMFADIVIGSLIFLHA